MRAQVRQRHDRIDRPAILHDMQVVFGEIHNARAVLTRYIGFPNVPFVRNGPIKDFGARRNLIDLERHIALEELQGLAHAVAGDASADREKLLDQCHHGPAVGLAAGG